jgi:hypothetical protein
MKLARPAIADTPRERHVETVTALDGEAVGEICPAFHLEIEKRRWHRAL